MNNETLREIVAAGLSAPSGDNLQPWTFSWNDETLEVHPDKKRDNSYLNVRFLPTIVSLGAVLTNISIAAKSRGWLARTSIVPIKGSLPFASVRFERTDPDKSPLEEAIAKRCTSRLPFKRDPLTPTLKNALIDVMQDYPDLQLDIFEDKESLHALADIAGEFDTFLFDHKRIQKAVVDSFRWSNKEAQSTRDGLPTSTLGASFFFTLVLRGLQIPFFSRLISLLWLPGRIAAARAKHLYRQSSAICLITGSADHKNLIQGGSAWQKIWLTLTTSGLSLQPLLGMILMIWRKRLEQLNDLNYTQRQRVDSCIQKIKDIAPALIERVPIAMFRIGRGQQPARTLRRTVDEVLQHEKVAQPGRNHPRSD